MLSLSYRRSRPRNMGWGEGAATADASKVVARGDAKEDQAAARMAGPAPSPIPTQRRATKACAKAHCRL